MSDSYSFILTTCMVLVPLTILSYIVGAPIRRPFSEAAALGFLLLTAWTNIGYEVYAHYQLPLNSFAGITLICSLVSAYILKCVIPWEKEEPPNNINIRTTCALAAASAIIFLKRTIYTVPRPQTQFFQSWYPDYIDTSLAANKFIALTQDTQLGEGFITSAQSYAVNSMGLIAFIESIYNTGDSFITYTVTTLLAALLGLWVLGRSLHQHTPLLYGFTIAVVFFVIADSHTQWTLGTNWSDEVIILGGAVLLYYFSTPDLPSINRLYGAILVSCCLVFGRNYGAFYGAIIAGILGIYILIKQKQQAILPLTVLGILFTGFTAPELYKIYTANDLFYPRINLLEIAPFSWVKFLSGNAIDWYIGHKSTLIHVCCVYFFGLFLIFKYKKQTIQNKSAYLSLFAPFALLALPLTLEIITGYRKSYTYSKLYHIAVWFPIWYPFHVARYLKANDKNNNAILPNKKVLFGYPSSLIILYTVAGLFLIGSNVKSVKKFINERFIGTPIPPAEQNIVAELKRNYTGKELEKLIQRPILYTHAEPGIGLRRFLGGNIFQDYDLFSDCMQSHIKENASLETFLKTTNAPIIYISHPPPLLYYAYTSYTDTGLFNKPSEYYKSLPYLNIVEFGQQVLMIPNPQKLGITDTFTRVCGGSAQ